MYRLCVRNLFTGLLQAGHNSEIWQWHYNLPTWCHRRFFDVVLFLFSTLVTGPSFIPISSLVLVLWLFTFIRDWPEIWKSKIPRLSFAISGDRGKLGTDVSNKMLLNAAKCQGYSFYRFWVIKGKPTGGRVKLPPPLIPPQLRLKLLFFRENNHFLIICKQSSLRSDW